MKKASLGLTLLMVVAACSQGYTQEEVDSIVDDAVDQAVADAEDEFTSEAEAQAQAEEAAKQAALVAAVDGCEGSSYITVDEGGLTMESQGDESPGTSYENILCVLDDLEIPDSILRRIQNTNSTMGLVEGSWGVYEASWSYHPDNGLAIYIVVTD